MAFSLQNCTIIVVHISEMVKGTISFKHVVCEPDNFSVPSQGTNCQCIFLKGMHLWITKISSGRVKTAALSQNDLICVSAAKRQKSSFS